MSMVPSRPARFFLIVESPLSRFPALAIPLSFDGCHSISIGTAPFLSWQDDFKDAVPEMLNTSLGVDLRRQRNFLSEFLIPPLGVYAIPVRAHAQCHIASPDSAQINNNKDFLGLMKDIHQRPFYFLE
jgi:hypothetical protein